MLSSIQEGQKEPVRVVVLDSSGQFLTGKTDIKIRIQRNSDLKYFDWSDDTFKAGSSVTQALQALQEMSATYNPGVYHLNTVSHVDGFDTSVITNPVEGDIYFITAVQDGGSDASNLPQTGEVRVAKFVVTDKSPTVF
jgi:hypothetical protein